MVKLQFVYTYDANNNENLNIIQIMSSAAWTIIHRLSIPMMPIIIKQAIDTVLEWFRLGE
jgi:hypothetical protein